VSSSSPPHPHAREQHLRARGYRSHVVGKWHLGFCKHAYFPTERGFDSFFGYVLGAHACVPPCAL
jgi:arylsulfatase A-like enzyme